MRWKLIFTVPIVAAVGAVVTWLLAIFVITHHTDQTRSALLLFEIINRGAPFCWSAAAAWFTYRHTAKRRKLQAFVVALLTLLITLTTYGFVSWYWHDQLFFTILKVPDYFEP